ncbi:virB8 family protein [Luteibacter sp. NPDC031894]|uniref:virB8 family protein n=1 Tax=Luteibacter sp. NPDC031894 TaxID=3390572 RepID=UPI003D08F494
MLKKRNSPKIDETVSRSVDFEVTIADLARRSERRAWLVALCASVGALILLGGYFYMLPLKEKVPYIVLADPYSGVSSVARLTDDLVNRRITSSEAVNRSNIAHFVLARESYDLALTNMRDWPTVMTMAAPNVSGPYRALHSPSNQYSSYKMYGTNKAIRVKILSIVMVGGGVNSTPKGATVRFQRSVFDKANGGTTPLDSKIATMEFVYKTNLQMDDQSRIENPLGFQVTSYRVDNDYGDAVPVEVPQAPASGGAVTNQPQVTGAPPATPAQTMDPDDMPPAAAVQGTQEPLQSGTLPPSPLPSAPAYPIGNAGTAVAAPTDAAPAARSTARSAANGGRR